MEQQKNDASVTTNTNDENDDTNTKQENSNKQQQIWRQNERLKQLQRGIAAPTELTMNQSLEGHKHSVVCSVWNETYRKLTTADINGSIIVWILHEDTWYEEMVNSRSGKPVCSVSWSPDGKKVCILYEDGTVIVGTVDGQRLWSKELKMQMQLCQWSPDSKTAMLATTEGDILFYDSFGNYLMRWSNDLVAEGNRRVVALEIYNGMFGYMEPHIPCLAMAFEDGQLYLLK